MKISMTDTNGTYTIETNEEYVELGEIIEMLIKPVLLAATFHPATIEKYIPSDTEEMSDWFVEFELDDEDEVVEKKAAVAKKAVPLEAVAKKAV
jgi:hypothetical protein